MPPGRKRIASYRAAFSGWPVIFGWLGMLIFTFHACTHMVAAGDTWVAMASGRHFVNHGVNTVEPFSTNSHKPGPTPEEVKTWPGWAQWIVGKVGLDTVKYWHPTGWINQNWLTHVMFYWLTTTLGSPQEPYFNALVFWKFGVYILAMLCIYFTARVLGANAGLSAVFTCFAMFISRSFLDIRPQGFSNLLVAAFLFVLTLATYRNVLYVWLIVPLTVFWCNVHGGYIYVFIMLVPFIGLHLLTSCSKKWALILYNLAAWPVWGLVAYKRTDFDLAIVIFLAALIALDIVLIVSKNNLLSIGRRGVLHTVAAGVVAFIAMVLFNPFHLTNLTHTLVISISKNAERWRDVHEWHRAFAWDNPVGTAIPFLVMYIIGWVALVVCVASLWYSSRNMRIPRRKKTDASDEYKTKIDLAIIAIAALTIYMAIRSRRFIPIAAFTACPVIAMLFDQAVRAISAVVNLRRTQKLEVPFMPATLKLGLTIAWAAYAAIAVIFFGTWWGLKFKRIYLDYWPADTEYKSIFMRMTASDAKPFAACQFIKDNKLKGKMFNYWTEGGFIAWGQEPDPNTGRTPLQLFMDGRAQAAYDCKTFDVWTEISIGGPTVQKAQMRGRDLTSEEVPEIGDWVSQQLRKWKVWVALMPSGQFNKPFTAGLDSNPEWPQVFLDNKQKLFVDVTTPQGKELFDGIMSGKTIYPDEFTRNLAAGHNLLMYGNDTAVRKQGLDCVIKAFNLNPSPGPLIEILLLGARWPELKAYIEEFCKGYADDFAKNKNIYCNQDGYNLRIEAARLVLIHLQNIAQSKGNKQLAESCAKTRTQYVEERNRISEQKRW